MKESEQECSKSSDGKAAVESRQDLSDSLWKEMKQESTVKQNKAPTEAEAAKAEAGKESLDIPSAFGAGHVLDELHQFHNSTRMSGQVLAHDPMEMVVNSGHAVDDDFRIFANPGLREAAEQQQEFELQSAAERVADLTRLPHPRTNHHPRASENPAGDHSSHSSPIGGAEVEHPLDPSTLRIPELPTEQPIPSRPIEIDRERLLRRASQAAQSSH